jgi:hypothetical protein
VADVSARRPLDPPPAFSADPPLLDALPKFGLNRGPVCYHGHFPEPRKGRALMCLRCRVIFVARKRRPPYRSRDETCYECGHLHKAEPKPKKRWTWVAT